jgi:hypothetical protein
MEDEFEYCHYREEQALRIYSSYNKWKATPTSYTQKAYCLRFLDQLFPWFPISALVILLSFWDAQEWFASTFPSLIRFRNIAFSTNVKIMLKSLHELADQNKSVMVLEKYYPQKSRLQIKQILTKSSFLLSPCSVCWKPFAQSICNGCAQHFFCGTECYARSECSSTCDSMLFPLTSS